MMERDEREIFERSVRNAAETSANGALDTALVDLGWHDALVTDTRDAVSLLFEVQGSTNTTSSALGRVIAFGAGADIDDATEAVLPAIGSWAAPGRSDDAALHVHGLALANVAERTSLLVVSRAGDTHDSIVVDASSLEGRPVRGVDPSLGLVEVTGTVALPSATSIADWRAGVALGQLAVGHELVGASRRMLELARQHALDRVQFDRPIATFQAIRHRLAETIVAIEAAAAVLEAAWLDRSPQSAAMAKATCARSARTTARHCQQVLAGIGFTTEHDLHRFVWRVLVLEQLLGAPRALTAELGREVLDRGRLPALVPL